MTLFCVSHQMIFAAESLGAVGTGKVANACVHYEVSFHVFLRKKATCWLVGNGKRQERKVPLVVVAVGACSVPMTDSISQTMHQRKIPQAVRLCNAITH